MATLLRTATRKSFQIILNKTSKNRVFTQPCCLISTSKKNKDSLTTQPDSTTRLEDTEEFKKLKEHFADYDPEKPKVSVSVDLCAGFTLF